APASPGPVGPVEAAAAAPATPGPAETAAAPVEAPKVEVPKVEVPVETARAGAPRPAGRTGGVAKAAGVIGAALLARDLYRAKDTTERVQVGAGAVGGQAGLALVGRVPFVGPVLAATAVGAGIGVGIGTVLAEDVIPDSAQRAYGKVLVEKGFGASRDDIELLERFEVLGYRPFRP
ncbi:hypothetical protein ICW40_02810, partial [Actinotalea ferrariae]|nr:hypothetical protein [Actinotalea ferrariae]